MAKRKTTKKKSAKKKTAKTGGKKAAKKKPAKKNSLVGNINKRKKAGKSRAKKDSTISADAYEQMQEGWPKTKRRKAARKGTRAKAGSKKSKESE
jgi:hypothetical protein